MRASITIAPDEPVDPKSYYEVTTDAEILEWFTCIQERAAEILSKGGEEFKGGETTIIVITQPPPPPPP